MTLVSEIIRDAYRESNLIAISADPTTAEQDEGLRLLNRVVSFITDAELGEQLDNVPIGRNGINRPQGFPYYDQVPDRTEWFVPANARLVLNLTSPAEVYLDPMPIDGQRFAVQDKTGNLVTNNFTVHGNGRTIGGANQVVFSTNNANSEYIYQADVGDWRVISPLISTDLFPYPREFDDLFIIALAMRINPRHANEIDPQSSSAYATVLKQFKSRYRQTRQMASELGLVRTSGTKSRYYDDTRFANSLWNSGWASPLGGYRW